VHVTDDELRILDLSRRPKGQWEPPIGALGGPPAHELYHDLVLHAGLRLLRDPEGRPLIELQDGERRHTVAVPSPELRGALDRFRMRRNLRPVAASDIEEFVRVVQARVSDPDEAFPEREIAPVLREIEPPASVPEGPGEAGDGEGWALRRLDHLMDEVDQIQGRGAPADGTTERPAWWSEYGPPVPLHSRLPHRWHASVSGAHDEGPRPDGDLSRYLRALHELVRSGAWIGSLQEIGRRTGDDSDEVFAALLKYHTDLVSEGLAVAPVELEEGWRWMVVDRSRIPASPDPRDGPARPT
jgi:hypothetical protein